MDPVNLQAHVIRDKSERRELPEVNITGAGISSFRPRTPRPPV